MTEPETEAGRERGSDLPRTPRSPGATLLAERRSQGLSLGDVARQLKLSVRQVEALERDEYSGFSGSVFVRGFLRNYAKLLHLDPDRVLEAAGESIAPARIGVDHATQARSAERPQAMDFIRPPRADAPGTSVHLLKDGPEPWSEKNEQRFGRKRRVTIAEFRHFIPGPPDAACCRRGRSAPRSGRARAIRTTHRGPRRRG